MKLIIAGSTGFVGTEVVRQALLHPAVTSVVGLSRRTTTLPHNADLLSKFTSLVCDDFANYSDIVKNQLVAADACIWLIAVTPSHARKLPWEHVHTICYKHTITGLETIAQTANKPFRFVYTSGANAERDPRKKPWIIGDYCLLRGEIESRVLDYANASNGAVQACIAKPGLIDAPGKTGPIMKLVQTIARKFIDLPLIDRSTFAATLLDQAINGINKDTLLNADLETIGQKALQQTTQNENDNR